MNERMTPCDDLCVLRYWPERCFPAPATVGAAAGADAADPIFNSDITMNEQLNLTSEWDKVFPRSGKVDHSKVTFRTATA